MDEEKKGDLDDWIRNYILSYKLHLPNFVICMFYREADFSLSDVLLKEIRRGVFMKEWPLMPFLKKAFIKFVSSVTR
jgi:hypothetical protein